MLGKIKNKRAQIWVETVIYTLIGLVIIGAVLAFATPAIEKQKDRATISKTVELLNELDNNIQDVKIRGVANKRIMSVMINEGELVVNSTGDDIIFVIDQSAYQYSELGNSVKIPGTNQVVLTEKSGSRFRVRLSIDYSDKMNLTYSGREDIKRFNNAPTPYNLVVENKGRDIELTDSLVNIDLYEN